MSETEVLKDLFIEKRIDLWWKDFIGQDPSSYSDLDFDVAEKAFPMSEIVSAKQVHDKFKGIFSYVEYRKTWYLWDGVIHTPCDGPNILEKVVTEFSYAYSKALAFLDEAIKRQAEQIKRSAVDAGDPEDAAKKFIKSMERKFTKARKFEERLGTNAGILAISRRLQTEFTIGRDYYENDRQWFVFKNGVLDLDALKRGKSDCVYSHDPLRNVTKYFDAEATGENLGHWDSFLQRSIPDDDSRKFLQKVTGAAFMGVPKTRMIANLFGPPGSGKSTFMDAINKLGQSGIGYCAALDKNAITKSNDQVNFGQNDFRGRRFISISEPDHRQPIDDDFLKNYTGDENVSTRGLYGSFEPWTPQGILFIASNAPLRINTRDLAIVERLHMIEFPNQFKDEPGIDPGHQKIHNIEELLYSDRSRILEWILEGMEMFINDSMNWNAPQKVIGYRGSIVASASVALRWLEDRIDEGYLEIDVHNKEYQGCLGVDRAYADFRMWKQFNGEKSNLSKPYFEEDISKKYFPAIRHNGTKVFPFVLKTDKYYKEYEIVPSNDTQSGNTSTGFKF